MASNDMMKKIMGDLMRSQLERVQQQAAMPDQRNSQALQRTPPPALPPVNQRTAELLQSLVGTGVRRKGDTKFANTGSPMMASRADMIAAQGGPSNQQESQWPTPPPGWGSQEDWDSLKEEERQVIAQQVAQKVQGSAAMPADIAAGHNLPTTDTGVISQMYGDTRTATPTPAPLPTMVGMDRPGRLSDNTASVQTQLSDIDAYLAAENYSYPPPGSEIDQETWEGFDTGDRITIAESIKRDTANAPGQAATNQVIETMETFQSQNPSSGGSTLPPTVGDILSSGASTARDALDDPASWAVEQVSRPIEARRDTESDVMYYMATHNGEMPPGFTGSAYGAINTIVGGINAIPSPTLRGQDDSPPTLEDVKQQMSSGQGKLSGVPDKTDTLIGPTWLAENEWAFPIVASVYETAEQTKKEAMAAAVESNDPEAVAAAEALPNGSEAVTEYFQSNQTTLGRLGEEILLDPLNLVFVNGVLKKGFLSAADKAYLAKHPELAKLLTATGHVVGTPNTILNEGPEKLFEAMGWAARRTPLGKPSEQAIRETAGESLQQADVLSIRATDPESRLMMEKQAAADAKIAKAQAEAQKIADAEAAAYQKATTQKGRLNLQAKFTAKKADFEKRTGLVFDDLVPPRTATRTTQSRLDDAARNAEAVPSAPRGETLTPINRSLKNADIQAVDNTVDNVAPVVDNAAERQAIIDSMVVENPEAMDYLAPGMLSNNRGPNLAQRVIDNAADNPAAARAFLDEYEPIAIDYVKRNPRGLDAAKGDSLESVLDDARTHVQVEEIYQKHFGEPSNYYNQGFRIKSKSNSKGAVERAVFGTDAESGEAFARLVDFSTNKGSKIDGALINELSQLRTRFTGRGATMTPSAAKPADTLVDIAPASAGPDPWDVDDVGEDGLIYREIAKGDAHFKPVSSRGDVVPNSDDIARANSALARIDEDLAYREGNRLDEIPGEGEFTRSPNLAPEDDIDYLIDHAIYGSADDIGPPGPRGGKGKKIPGSATRARDILRNKFGLYDQATRAKNLRQEIFPDLDEFKGSGKGMGIVNDPRQAAAVAADATRSAFGKAANKIPPPRKANAVGNSVADVPMDVQYASRLQDMFATGKVTQNHVNDMTKRFEINLGSKEKPVLVKTSFWETFNEQLDLMQSKREQIPWGNLTTDGEITSANKRWMTEFDEDYIAARAKTKELFQQVTQDPNWSRKNPLQVMDRGLTSAMSIARQNAMYNPVTGVGAGIQDFLGNVRTAALGGSGKSARNIPSIGRWLSKHGNDPDTWMDMPALSGVKNTGVTPPADLFRTVGREQFDRSDKLWTTRVGDALHIPKKLNILQFVASERIKALRQFQDSAWRISVYADTFMDGLGRERVKFLRFAEDKLGGMDEVWDELRALGPSFSPDDVRRVTRNAGLTDDSFARTWAKQVDDLSRKANKKQNSLFFTYKKTQADEILARGFMFHYWMTRHSLLYAKLMMQHPQLIRLESELWKWTEENRSKLPAPKWMEGFVGWAYDNGHIAYMDPVAVLSGLTVYSQIGEKSFARSGLEGMMNQTGLFPNPILRAAFSTLGLFSPGDPTMTTGLRRAMYNVIDQIRNSDYGKEKGWQGLTPDHLQDGINWIVETANKAAKNLPGGQDIDLPESLGTRQNRVQRILMDNMLEEFGEDPNQWTDDQWAQYVAARDAITYGLENEDAASAIDEYLDMESVERAGNAVSPTSVIVQDRGAEENARILDQGYTDIKSGNDPSPEFENLADLDEMRQIEPGPSTDLALGTQSYYNAGDEVGRHNNQQWTAIVYNLDEYPDFYEMTAGGQTYTVAELKEMTEEQRIEIADQWLADQEPVQGASTDPDYVAPNRSYERLKSERAAVKKDNPILADFLTYRSWMLNKEDEAPGKIRADRQAMEAYDKDSEFARALGRERDRLQEKGLAGEELELALDKWMGTEEAYAAIMGYPWKDGGGGRGLYAPDSQPWLKSGEGSSSSSSKAGDTKGGKEADKSTETSYSPTAMMFRDLGYFIDDFGNKVRKKTYPWRQDKDSTGSDFNKYSSGTPSIVEEFLLRR